MTAAILDGRPVADRLLDDVRAAVEARQAQGLRRPSLAIILAGENPGALAYARRQAEFAERAGVSAKIHGLPGDVGLSSVMALIAALNTDPGVDAILPLFPFPAPIRPLDLAHLIDPAKDVDGLHPLNAGRLAIGLDGYAPCTALGAVTLAETVVGDFKGVPVTIVGASISVGRPLAQLLLAREATVTLAHAATRDLRAACRTAQVVFVAVGRAGLITAEHLAPGAVVIDIGINMVSAPENGPDARKLVGDVDLLSAQTVAKVITAVPDGVGPLTTAFLMANTLRAAQAR